MTTTRIKIVGNASLKLKVRVPVKIVGNSAIKLAR